MIEEHYMVLVDGNLNFLANVMINKNEWRRFHTVDQKSLSVQDLLHMESFDLYWGRNTPEQLKAIEYLHKHFELDIVDGDIGTIKILRLYTTFMGMDENENLMPFVESGTAVVIDDKVYGLFKSAFGKRYRPIHKCWSKKSTLIDSLEDKL